MEHRSNLPSGLIAANITCDGGRTTVRLDPELYLAATVLCSRFGISMNELVELAQRRSPGRARTAAIRGYVVAALVEAWREQLDFPPDAPPLPGAIIANDHRSQNDEVMA